MLVLGTIIDQQQEAGGRQALDQAAQQSLGLGINPVEILKDQQQWLYLALTQQHALERVERALAALGWIEVQKCTVVWQRIQE